MSTLKSVPGSEIFFQLVRKRVATTPHPLNKTGWSYENKPCKEGSFERWINLSRLLPKAPGILVFFLINDNNELTYLKSLYATDNLQKAFYSITNLKYLEEIWDLLEDGKYQVMVQLAKVS